jgi:hypothetical protein
MSKNGSKRSFIDSVEVKTPCTESWDEMSGNERVRFCSHCSKHVNNLSELTRKEAARLVRSSGGNLCIRYRPHPVTRRPMFAEQLFQITRRTPRLTAGVMSASLGLSTVAYTQGGANVREVPLLIREASADTGKREMPAEAFGGLYGTISDGAGAVVPEVRVTMTQSSGRQFSTTTNSDGFYRFEKLPIGVYALTTDAQRGFTAARIENIEVYEGQQPLIDLILEIDNTVALAGGISFIEYRTALASAVSDEDVDRVRELLAAGEDVNAKDEGYDNITPLFLAVEAANLEIVRLLLDFGAKVNVRDEEGRTPLMRLDEDATPELVDLLASHGAKLNLADKEKNTPLIIGIENNIGTSVVEAMIRAGADVRMANKEGTTALMNAAGDNNFEMVKLLVEAGADVNAKDDEGGTAWDKTSDEEIEGYLVGHGAIVDPD